MAAFVKRRHSLFSRDHERGLRTVLSVTPNGEREAWGMAATMDHSSIRGLGTALHLFLAGLPRSKYVDHPKGRSLKIVEDSPNRSDASRSRLGVLLEVAAHTIQPALSPLAVRSAAIAPRTRQGLLSAPKITETVESRLRLLKTR